MCSLKTAIVFAALLLVLQMIRADGESMTVCPVNVQEFILRNSALLPPANIRATSEDSVNNPVAGFIETTSAPWCTAQGEGIPERTNYVELTFTERIVVEFLESTGLLESWVSNFSIQYSQSESGEDFITYGVLEAPQSFIVEDILTSPGYFSLERPIVARRLRLVINSGTMDVFSRLCWEVEIFGCTLSRAQQIQDMCQGTMPLHSTTTTVSVESENDPSQSVPQNTPAPNCPDTSDTVLSASERQQEILIIVLPIALATIVIVLIIAILSILICVCVTRRSGKAKPTTNQNANNPCFLYDSPRPSAYDVPRASIRSRGGSFASSNDTLHTAISNEVKNPVYVTKQGHIPGPVAPHPFSSLSNQVESSATNDYEMISDNVTTMDNRLYEMQRSNSQQSGATRPELPAARTVDPSSSSSYYAMIPGGDKPTTATTPENNQSLTQTGTTRDGNVNVDTSVKSLGYAKVHKPSNSQPKVGPDVVPAVNETINQTTL